MKRSYFGILLSLVFCSLASGEPLKVKVSAKSAILMNAETGTILYEKNGHETKYPASTTKLATMLYAIEQAENQLDQMVDCPYHCLQQINFTLKEAHDFRDPAYWLEPDGTHYWIKRGEKLSLRDLLYGMMLVSGNDASNFIAHYVGGTIPKFMSGLNKRLKKMGCKNTHFLNPHGLHHPEHLTTAYDMALITKEVLKNKVALEISSTKDYERPETNKQSARSIQNTNKFLQPGKFFYSKSVAAKNGYHMNAGHTFAGAAEYENRTLIAVLMGCQDSNERYRDAIRLFETAFAETKETRLLFNKEENFFTRDMKQGKHPMQASLIEDVLISYYPAEEPNICIELNWEDLPLPIQEGTWVGELNILDEHHQILEKAPLYATREVKKKALIAFIDELKTGSLALTFWQKILTFFLLIGLSCSLYFLFRFEKLNLQ